MSNSDFYRVNYHEIISHRMDVGANKIFFGTLPKVCRICDRNHSETTFKKEAHTVPEFLGNKILFSNDECDECNEWFGLLESDFGAMTLANRTIGGVTRKRSGLPTYKNGSDKFRMQQVGNTLKIDYKTERTGIFIENKDENGFELALPSNPFRPLAVFKSLTKIGYMLLPDELVPEFKSLKSWLQDKELNNGTLLGIYGHGCLITTIPGFNLTIPTTRLFVRITDVNSPFCILHLTFGHFIFQSVIPCPTFDFQYPNNRIILRAIPSTYNADEDHEPKQPEWVDLSKLEKIINTQTWVAKGKERTLIA